jgi:hypothetical protein
MAPRQRILVLGTTYGGGNWPPLAAVTVGLHQAGHEVRCFGDAAIAHEFASAAIPVEVGPAEATLGTFMAQWRAAGYAGPAPFRAWAEACLPGVRALMRDFKPRVVLSEIFTAELARLTKAASGLRWCCVNPGYYFGPDSIRSREVDYVGRSGHYREQFGQAIGDADLVLHGTDPVFDPPPPSLPQHHHYVGPLWWEPSSEAPTYLDVPGPPWVLVTVSSSPQPEEMTLARTALRALALHPVRVLLTLSSPIRQSGPSPRTTSISCSQNRVQSTVSGRLLTVCGAGSGSGRGSQSIAGSRSSRSSRRHGRRASRRRTSRRRGAVGPWPIGSWPFNAISRSSRRCQRRSRNWILPKSSHRIRSLASGMPASGLRLCDSTLTCIGRRSKASCVRPGSRGDCLPNSTLDRTGGSHSLAAAGQPGR